MNYPIEQLRGKKVLVTGGTGFIGNVFVSSLAAAGASVVCLTRKTQGHTDGVEYISCDLTHISPEEGEILRSRIGKVDHSVYLAASIPLVSAGKETMTAAKKNNLDALLNFLDVFGESVPMIVFASTVDVYGIPSEENFSEEAAIHPNSTYAVAKYCCEKYLEFYCGQHGKSYNILRFAQVYGPREPLVRVIPIILDAIRNKKEFTLKGDGSDTRRFIYVADVAAALAAAMCHPHNSVYNISGKEDIRIADIIQISEKLTGEKLNCIQTPAIQKPVHILPSSAKASTELGFSPRFSFKEGMAAVIKDLYENK